MGLYAVEPRERTWGCSAPEIFVEAENSDKAVELAKSQSRLGAFPNWAFHQDRVRSIPHDGRYLQERFRNSNQKHE